MPLEILWCDTGTKPEQRFSLKLHAAKAPRVSIRSGRNQNAEAIILICGKVAVTKWRLKEEPTNVCPGGLSDNRTDGVVLRSTTLFFQSTFFLSYPEPGSCAIQEPSSGTAFMPGDGEGRIVFFLVVTDRRGVRSPPSFLMT